MQKEKKLYAIIISLIFLLATTTTYILFSEKQNTNNTDCSEIIKMYQKWLDDEQNSTEYFMNKYYNARNAYMILWNATIDCHNMSFPFII